MNQSNSTSMMNDSNTNPSSSCTYWKPDSDVIKTVKLVLMMVIGGIGILNNIFIVVIAVGYTVRKNLHHLIVNMAVSDTFVILFTCVQEILALRSQIPLLVTKLKTPPFPFLSPGYQF